MRRTTQAGVSALIYALLGLAVAAWAAEAPQAATPLAWLTTHWTQLVTAVAAFFLVHYVRRMDRKFDVLFQWKRDVDTRMGVHDQVWNRGDGCGPIWLQHQPDGTRALQWPSADHPGLCEHCRALYGHVIQQEQQS